MGDESPLYEAVMLWVPMANVATPLPLSETVPNVVEPPGKRDSPEQMERRSRPEASAEQGHGYARSAGALLARVIYGKVALCRDADASATRMFVPTGMP